MATLFLGGRGELVSTDWTVVPVTLVHMSREGALCRSCVINVASEFDSACRNSPEGQRVRNHKARVLF